MVLRVASIFQPCVQGPPILHRSPALRKTAEAHVSTTLGPSALETVGLGGKQLVRLHRLLNDALLVNVPHEGFKGIAVRLEAIGERVGAEYGKVVLYVLHQPWEHAVESAGPGQLVHGLRLGLL